jgi:hypothetical protein
VRVKREMGSTANSHAAASVIVIWLAALVRVSDSTPASLNVIFTDASDSANVVPVDDRETVKPSHVLSFFASGRVMNAGVIS